MARKLASRKDVVRVLLRILANYEKIERIMDKGDKRIIEDAIHCIEAEMENFHEWGGDAYECVVLHWPPESRQILEMGREELFQIYKKYRFVPADNDKLEHQLQIQQMIEVIQRLKGSENDK